jgi:hypothetical protein
MTGEAFRWEWEYERPSTTVCGDPRLSGPRNDPNVSGSQYGKNARKITVAEAGVLQGFPADYPWQGTRTSQFRQAGNAVPLFSWGVLDANGNVARDPTFPDLPHFVEAYEMLQGRKPSGVEFNAYMAFFGSGFAAQKPAMLPRGTAPEIVAAYRRSFAQAVADPDLQSKKGEVLGDYEQAVGDNIQRLYEVATTIDPDARAWVRNYLATNHNARL